MPTFPDPHAKRLAFARRVVLHERAPVSIGETVELFHQPSIEIPAKPTKYEDFEAKVVDAKDDNEKLRGILDNTPAQQLQDFYHLYRKDEKRILTDLSSAARKAGFYTHKKNRLFAERLREKGIPVRGIDLSNGKSKYPQVSWITYSQCEVSINALRDDPSLQEFKENPVQLICGAIGIIPTTTQLHRKEEYFTLSKKTLKALGINPKELNLTELFDENCPIPIIEYKLRKSLFCPNYGKRDLKAFLQSKLEEARLKTFPHPNS